MHDTACMCVSVNTHDCLYIFFLLGNEKRNKDKQTDRQREGGMVLEHMPLRRLFSGENVLAGRATQASWQKSFFVLSCLKYWLLAQTKKGKKMNAD